MPADDFVCPIAFDRCRASIPVADRAVGIEHIDRMVANALDEHAEALLAFVERALRFAPLGDVARDLGEAEQGAVFGADRIDHDLRPETGAVLAHPPALGFEPSLLRRGPEDSRRKVGCLVLRCEEGREMCADDLAGLIALEAARARIPGRDMAARLEHVDGVVGDRIDQQLETLLGDPRVEMVVGHFRPLAGPERCRRPKVPPRLAS